MLTHLPGFERHMRVLRALSAESVKSYCKKVEEFNAWLEGNDNLKLAPDVTRQDVENYLEWCFYKGNKNNTRFTKLTALQNFFRYLVYNKIIEQDPTTEIPRPKASKKFVQKFTPEEVIKMFACLDVTTEKGLRDVVILIGFAFCGFRMDELITINLNALVDDGKRIDIMVRGKQRDGSLSRSVDLWVEPSAYIRAYMLTRLSQGAKGKDALLISYMKGGKPKGKPLTAKAVDDLIKKICHTAGLRKPEIHAHMFRAGHINDLRHIKGYDSWAIAERVGHMNTSTTDGYVAKRERIHKQYNSLREYWNSKGFNKLWKEIKTDANNGGNSQSISENQRHGEDAVA